MTNSYGVVVVMYHGDYHDDWDTHISDVRELLIPMENFKKGCDEFDARSNALYRERFEALKPYTDGVMGRSRDNIWKRGQKIEGQRIEAEYKAMMGVLDLEFKTYVNKWTTKIEYMELSDEL